MTRRTEGGETNGRSETLFWKATGVVVASDIDIRSNITQAFNGGMAERGENEGNAVKQQQEALLYLTSSKMGSKRKSERKAVEKKKSVCIVYL